MPNDLIYGAPEVSTDMFAAIPAAIGDPFLYIETAGRKIALLGSLDHASVRAVAADVELLDPRAHGMLELIKAGVRRREAENRTIVKLLAGLGVDAARVSWDFPVSVADALRAAGVALTVDGDPFDARRRVKSPAQLDGIRRAQAAADTAMGLARDLVHACPADLTAEAVRAAMRGAAGELGCDLPDDVIVAVNGQAADGHESGHGPITAGDHVLVDIWPRDRASRCWADMTRTFMAGGATPDAEL
ncbi:MAG: Xaa-Pro aminopeptidase, partial [Solirubrobacteraceae bacterium]|nr:Xaa-Pro aminopeptidase [Solirubrobacteraceae bacterium]